MDNVVPHQVSKSKVEQIVSHVKNGISAGRYVPGQRLVESDLTADLGISRGPLREAMRLLTAIELLELVPNRGARVRKLQPDDIRQRFQLLNALGRLAIINFSTTTSALELPADEADNSRISLLSRIADFYSNIARKSDNELLANYIYKLNFKYFSRHIIIQFNLDTDVLNTHYRQILQALHDGDIQGCLNEHQNMYNQIMASTESIES